MSNGVGFRVYKSIVRPKKQLIEQFRGLPTGNITDNMGRFYCVSESIRPINNQGLLGCAFTVRVPEGDNLMLHYAIGEAQEGDIIVVDGGGCVERALMGEVMSRYAAKRGIGGFLVDGAIRDSEAIRELSIPVYARGITPRGPYKNGPGEINVPICCGGQVIFPGDIIVGDMDGVAVIRPDEAEEIALRAWDLYASEQVKFSQIDEHKLNTDWVLQTLTEKGLKIID